MSHQPQFANEMELQGLDGLVSSLSHLKGVGISLFYVLYCVCACAHVCTYGAVHACGGVLVHSTCEDEKTTSSVSQSSPFTFF